MPKDIFVRAIQGDMNNTFVRQAAEWLARIAPISHLDTDVLQYPKTTMLQAFEKATGRPLLYMPVHPVFMMESLGPNPEASQTEIAAALAQITKTIHWESLKQGQGEFYMPCSDGNVINFAMGHGYSRMTYATQKEIPAEQQARGSDDAPEPTKVITTELHDIPFLKMKVYR